MIRMQLVSRRPPHLGVALCLVLVFGFLLSQEGRAQRRNLASYTLADGLPQSQVWDAVQGPRGYLWLGLYGGGVARFDGQRFEALTIDDGLPSNTVTTLHAASSGVLWIGTRGGLARYDGATVQTFTAESSELPHDNVYAVADGPGETLWFGTPEGVVAYNGTSFRPVAPDRVSDTYDGGIAAQGDTLWIGASEGLYRYSESTLAAVPLPDVVADDAVTTLSIGPNGLWVETSAGLFQYHEGRFDRLSGTEELEVLAVRDASDGSLWVGARDGLYRREGKRRLRRFPSSLGNATTKSIFADREQNVWFGTDGRGLFKYTPTPFDRFTPADGLSGRLVWDVDEGPEGRLWAATRNGLSRYDGTTFTTMPGPDGRLKQELLSVYWTETGTLWIGSRSTLFAYDGSSYRSYERVAGGPVGLIHDIAEAPSGAVWFATTKGVLRYDDSGFTRYTTDDGLVSNQVRFVTVDGQGRVWAGEGVSRFDGGRFHPTEAVVESEIESVIDLEVDEEGTLWIGTQQGVYVHPSAEAPRPDSLVSFAAEEGLSGSNAVFLLFARSGHLWVGTEDGVNRLDVETYRQTGEMPIRSYGRKKGLFVGQATQHSDLEASDGKLWFGSSRGLARYNPAEERPRTEPPQPYVTSVGLFSESADWGKYAEGTTPWEHLPVSPTLPPDKNHLIFRYVGLSYVAPDEVQYRYRLDGFSERWSKPTSERRATYSNLPAGSYTFQVKASKGEGRWSSRTATYTFTIERPFWQATWFYALCGLGGIGLAIGLFVGAVRWRTRRLKKEKEVLERQLSQRSKKVKERWS